MPDVGTWKMTWESASKTRRHHNNKGLRQIKRGKTAEQVELMAERLGLKFKAYKHGDKAGGKMKRIPSHIRGWSE